MDIRETTLPGVYEVELERLTDERGFFARSWCREEFARRGLNPNLEQCSVSVTTRKGTLRGMHFQSAPFAEAKLVRCTRGSVYDVAVDLRTTSPTFRQWIAVVLTAEKHNMLYVPENCAHGFLTLQDDVEVFYQISESYHPEASFGVRWNDPAFQITWPDKVEVISERDRKYPDFRWV